MPAYLEVAIGIFLLLGGIWKMLLIMVGRVNRALKILKDAQGDPALSRDAWKLNSHITRILWAAIGVMIAGLAIAERGIGRMVFGW